MKPRVLRCLRSVARSLAAAALGALALHAVAADPPAARSLPPEVEAALAHAGLPREAMVAWVEEVGATRPRSAWQGDKPVNPASLMKLATTYAGLELLGPAFTWATPVWLQGPVVDGVLQGNLVIKGTGDPKLVMERLWLLMRRGQQGACARSAATSSSTAAPSCRASSTRPISTASPCAPTTPAPTPCSSTTARCC